MPTVLITGANRGIGLEFARAFADRGDTVIGTARRPEAATELAEIAEVLPCEVSNDDSVAGLAERLGGRPVDLLLNNAGIMRRGALDGSLDAMREQFEVNTLGPLRVTRALLPNLRAADAARVVHITSRMGSIGDNTSGGGYGYRMSKAALNMAGKSMAHDLAPIPVLLLHPGAVRTEMTSGHGDIEAPEAVRRMLEVIDGLDAARSGAFYHRDGFELPW